MTPAEIVLAVGGVLAAFVIGSATNVVIDRFPVPLDEPNDMGELWTTAPWRDVFSGRSRCSSCGEPVRPLDNIPVISWIVLRGRCRSCGEPYGGYHPLVELLVPALAVIACLAVGRHWTLAAALWLVPAGVALAVIDLRTMIVPLRIVWPTFFVSVGIVAAGAISEGQPHWLLGALIGAAILSGPLAILWFIHPRGMGFGDVRLAVLVGWNVGFAAAVADSRLIAVVLISALCMAVSATLGIMFGLVMVGFRRQHFPFGPAFVLGGLASVDFARQVIHAFSR